MNVTWVSSVSWYFLCLFGLNSLYRLILGRENVADGTTNPIGATSDPTIMMGGIPGATGGVDYTKLFKGEKDNLELVQHCWISEGVEQRLLNLYAPELVL